MLNLPSRLLLKTTFRVEKNSLLFKCCSNGKANFIKNLNLENRYIYGSLLETQKQRRKRLNKVLHNVPENSKQFISKEESEDCTSIEDTTKSKQGSKKRTKKCKSNEVKIDSYGVNNSLPTTAALASTDSGVNNKNLESGLCQISSHKKSKTLETPLTKNKINKTSVKLPNEFIFKSSILIDEVNYPLHNSEKSEIIDKETVLKYSFSDPLTKNYATFPSVSKIMEETMPEKNKAILSRWRKNMIAEIGEEGFNKYTAGLKARGSEFHLAVHRAVLGETAEDCSEITVKALQSLEWMLPHVSRPLAVESIVAHPKLEYRGIPDCVALFRDTPVVIDWKLSDKPKKQLKDTYEAPVQISAYIGALNHDPNYKWGVSHGLVAVAYSNGDPCDVFLLAPQHCQIYWRHWLMRFNQFKARNHLHVDHKIDEASLGLI